MKQSFTALRITLGFVIFANTWFAWVFFASPQKLSQLYELQVIDVVHQYLAMSMGASLFVFALGALIAFLRPLQYGSIIIMLLLSNFSLFLIDVITLARGGLSLQILLPEMLYFLVVSTALVRYYPLPFKEVKEEPQVDTSVPPVEVVVEDLPVEEVQEPELTN